MTKLKAYIFDLDGTLVKTQSEFHATAEVEVLKKCGISLTADSISERFAGVHTLEVFKELAPNHDPHKLLKNKWEIMYAMADQKPIEPLSFARELVRGLSNQNIPLAIASASPLEWIKICIGKIGLQDLFHTLASADEVAHGKPEPDVFLLAARRLNVRPENCIAIDDGRAGAIAGVRANMKTFWLTQNSDIIPGTIKISSLKEIISNK